jgi:hypothetical protein
MVEDKMMSLLYHTVHFVFNHCFLFNQVPINVEVLNPGAQIVGAISNEPETSVFDRSMGCMQVVASASVASSADDYLTWPLVFELPQFPSILDRTLLKVKSSAERTLLKVKSAPARRRYSDHVAQ